MDLQNSKTHVKCCSKSQMLVSVSAPNGDFVSSSSSSSSYNGSNTVLQKNVSIFKITVSLLLARNNKHQNFKNPTLELAWSSRLSCLLFFFNFLLAMDVCSSSGRESCWRRRQAEVEGKKKMVVVLLVWTSHVICHVPFLTKFLVCLATKIVAFFIKIANFTLMGPAGLLAAVAHLFAATSMVWKHCFTPWCESSSALL